MRAPSPPFVLSEAEQQQSQSYGVLQSMSGPAPPSPITTSSSSSRQKRTRRHSSRHARRSRSHGHRSRRRTDKRRRHRSNSSNSNTSATASSRSSSASSSQVSTRHSSLRKDSAQQQQRHRSSHGHHHSHHRRHHRHSSSTSSSSSRHRHRRSRKEALLHAERYNYGGADGEVDGGGNGVLPLDITSANLSYTSDLNNVAATTTGEAVAPRLDPVEKDIPLSDWVCGVCSNLNSMQRSACYRCAVSYAESQRAKPCEEIVLVPVPAEKTEMAVAQVVARVTSQGGSNATPTGVVATSQGKTSSSPVEGMIIAQYYDAKQKALYLRFVSVAEATRALVFCRCQLILSEETDSSTHRDGDKDGEGVHASDAPVLPLSCRMTFSRANKTARVDTAGLSRREMRQAMNAVLDQPKVKSSGKDDSTLPRELRAQNWQPPASFASAAEEKAYLTLLSDHWAQLSAAQREYYEVRVKQSLTSKASDSQAHTISNSKDTPTTTSSQTAATTGTVSTGSLSAVESLRRRMEEKKNALKKAAEAAASTVNSSDSSTPVAAPTSNSLASLKQRLAEKKAKLAGDSATSTTVTSNDTTTSASSTITTLVVATNTDNRCETSAQAGMGDDAAEPVTLYDNFPLPPRYVGWAARADATPPRLEQTWHIPLAIAQRVLPPALLKQQQQPRLNTYSRGH